MMGCRSSSPVGSAQMAEKPTEVAVHPAPVSSHHNYNHSALPNQTNQGQNADVQNNKIPQPNTVEKPTDNEDVKHEDSKDENSLPPEESNIRDDEDGSETKGHESATEGVTESKATKNDALISEEKMLVALHAACLLLKPRCIYNSADAHVTKLHLSRALPHTVSLTKLLSRLTNLQDVDISGNRIGPQGFRAIMVSLCHNNTILSLNVANNGADTDSAPSVGDMLMANNTLQWLDVSGNNLGRDFLSRCVGPSLKVNKSLVGLKFDSCGSVDVTALLEGLKSNNTLQELSLNHNQMTNGENFAKKLSELLQSENCSISRLHCKNCGIGGAGIEFFAQALTRNTTLIELDTSGFQCADMSSMLTFILKAALHPTLSSLIMDDVTVSSNDCDHASVEAMDHYSHLTKLSIANCKLTDKVLSTLAEKCKGRLHSLIDLNLTNNSSLTADCLTSVHHITTDDDHKDGSLCKLSLGLTSVEDLGSALSDRWPQLDYLNLRKAKISPSGLSLMQASLGGRHMRTLVLDGIKLSSSSVITDVLGAAGSHLKALSLSGCQLNDTDMKQLTAALPRVQLHMLKLSANRITDNGIEDMVSSLLSLDTHDLQLIDISDNQISCIGAEKLKLLFTDAKFKCKLHTLNLANNAIDVKGLRCMVSLVGRTALTSLQLNNQRCQYNEEDIEEVLSDLAHTLGLHVNQTDVSEDKAMGTCDLPSSFSASLMVKLSGLGEHAGPLSRLLDSVTIQTDYRSKQMSHMTLDHVLQLAAKLQGHNSESMLVSQKEWNQIIGSDKGAPSWLQVSAHRDRAVYLSHLPAVITTQKMEAVLENEADCNVKEVCLMKDIVLKKNNGLAWALMADEMSVQRAKQLLLDGQALVFGQSFLISRVNVTVDDDASHQVETQAQQDMARRQKDRVKEEAAHQSLIRQSYQESQERHAYRLAHPAYADGRIW